MIARILSNHDKWRTGWVQSVLRYYLIKNRKFDIRSLLPPHLPHFEVFCCSQQQFGDDGTGGDGHAFTANRGVLSCLQTWFRSVARRRSWLWPSLRSARSCGIWKTCWDLIFFAVKRGRLVATEAASELFDEVSRIYDLISQLRRTAVNIRNRRGGHIRLGTLPSLGLALVPTAIAQLHAQSPELTFSVSTLHSDEIIASLLEKRCDICVGFELDAGDRIESAAIAQCEFLLVTQAGTIDSPDDSVPLSTIENLPFIGIRGQRTSSKVARRAYR